MLFLLGKVGKYSLYVEEVQKCTLEYKEERMPAGVTAISMRNRDVVRARFSWQWKSAKS
jgi:hypothetical protein